MHLRLLIISYNALDFAWHHRPVVQFESSDLPCSVASQFKLLQSTNLYSTDTL